MDSQEFVFDGHSTVAGIKPRKSVYTSRKPLNLDGEIRVLSGVTLRLRKAGVLYGVTNYGTIMNAPSRWPLFLQRVFQAMRRTLYRATHR